MIFWKKKNKQDDKTESEQEQEQAQEQSTEQKNVPDQTEQPPAVVQFNEGSREDQGGGNEADQKLEESTAVEAGDKRSWSQRLTSGLSKSASKLSGGITGIFTKAKLDDEMIEALEDLLVSADLGPKTATRLTQKLAEERYDKEISPEAVKEILAEQIGHILSPVAQPLMIDQSKNPYVILVVGVNGTGKTTTIAKYAKQFQQQGKGVLLAAGDTFRAAAVEQLEIWAKRTGSKFLAKDIGADPAAVAFEAVEQGINDDNIDIVMIDTAGRLHNRAELMDELGKIQRVIGKRLDGAPHATLITLDATTGQNALNQVELFNAVTPLSGMVVTKLDGTARGGIVVTLADRFGLPIHAVGVGESADDLQPFDPAQYAKALLD